MKNGLEIDAQGIHRWYKDDKLHRDDDLPAVIYPDGTMYWYQYDRDHRENGPADMYADGSIYWWLNGTSYKFDDWCIKLNKSPKEKAMLMLQYMD